MKKMNHSTNCVKSPTPPPATATGRQTAGGIFPDTVKRRSGNGTTAGLENVADPTDGFASRSDINQGSDDIADHVLQKSISADADTN